MFQFTKALSILSELQVSGRLIRLLSFCFRSLRQGRRVADPLFISPLCALQGEERISALRWLNRLTRPWVLVVLFSCLLPRQGDAADSA